MQNKTKERKGIRKISKNWIKKKLLKKYIWETKIYSSETPGKQETNKKEGKNAR